MTHVAGGVLRMRVPSPTLRSQVGALVWGSGLCGHGFGVQGSASLASSAGFGDQGCGLSRLSGHRFGVQGSVGMGLGFKAQWAWVWGSWLSGHGFGVQGSVGMGLGFRAQWAWVWGSGLSGLGFGVQGSAGSVGTGLGIRVAGSACTAACIAARLKRGGNNLCVYVYATVCDCVYRLFLHDSRLSGDCRFVVTPEKARIWIRANKQTYRA